MQIQGTITPLTWESDFFGFRTARLMLGGDQWLSFAERQEYALLQAKVSSDDYSAMAALNRLGFQFAEGEATLVMPLEQTERQPGIRIARAQQIPALRDAAGQVFTQSRFRAPWFAPEQCQQFYAQWIENAVNGHFDDQCLVASDAQGAIQGFVSVRERTEDACIGLLGVLPAMQGQGIGQRLLRAAADWGRVRGATQLQITTQLSNVAAMRLYLRNGARLEKTACWFYRSADDSL